jgi:hypothetical protein
MACAPCVSPLITVYLNPTYPITFRYLGSDEEAGSDAEDGLPVRQSQGADLQQLLAESEQFYAQAHFRYRSFIEAVDTQPPPVDVAAFEEVRRPGPPTQLCQLMCPHAFTCARMHSHAFMCT